MAQCGPEWMTVQCFQQIEQQLGRKVVVVTHADTRFIGILHKIHPDRSLTLYEVVQNDEEGPIDIPSQVHLTFQCIRRVEKLVPYEIMFDKQVPEEHVMVIGGLIDFILLGPGANDS